MIWLLLSILCSTALMLIFVLFKKYKIDTFHAIVVNYITAVVIAVPLVSDWQTPLESYFNWYYYALILGCLFISLFFLIGKTTQQLGVSVTTVAMKLGYVIPIFLAFSIYQENISSIKLFAIGLTVIAVIFSSVKNEKQNSNLSNHKYLLLLPIIIFIGSGICDAIVQFVEKTFFLQNGFEAFLIILFATASVLGFLFALVSDFQKKQNHFTKKNILAGVLLGIPNYGSIYFLFKALNAYPNNSAAVFPVNNVGIVVLSTLIAIILFKEKLSWINIIGFILAVISIVIMSFENLFPIF